MNHHFLRPLLFACVLALGSLLFGVGNAHADDLYRCEDGMAGPYPCDNVNLVGHLSLEALGGDPLAGNYINDIWGWTNGETGREFAIVGLRDGTAFVEVTAPDAPVYIGRLPSAVPILSDYRDMKVYQNYAFIVGDIHPGQGMQVFDLTRLEAADPLDYPVTFDADAFYNDAGLEYGHNLWINTATGFAYVFRSASCGGATHIINIQDPLNPTFAGCLDSGTDDSDGECVLYTGPDADYSGREICVVGSDEWVTIGDVTDKGSPVVVAIRDYPNVRRAHQGAFTADLAYWLISDTMDEQMLGHNTRTHVIDLNDLDNPTYVGYFEHATTARDHNLYVDGHLVYQTNWRAGFRVIDMGGDPGDVAGWQEIAYLDTFPDNDAVNMKSGAWSSYSYLQNGTIAVSDVESGLFLLQVELSPTDVGVSAFGGRVAVNNAPALLAGVAALLGLGAVAWYRRADD